ncbi:MAG: flagellin FliC [Acidobacteria bacterium]|nr:flagellin FliC [Acidobacteriota bacterium]
MPSILNNVAALGATRQLGITNLGLQRTIERLTTGKRINRANDDAAGLSIANSLGASVRVETQARRNANDGYFQLQTMDGYLEEATQLATRAAELESAYKGANAAGQTAINAEYTQIGAALTAIDGQRATVTADAGAYGTVTATKTALTALAGSAAAGNSATVLTNIATERGNYGAYMAQLSSYANVLGISSENKTAQRSQIMDADVGTEVVNLSKWQILNQSGISALAQANSAGQAVLALLR